MKIVLQFAIVAMSIIAIFTALLFSGQTDIFLKALHASALFGFLSIVVLALIWYERKLLARIQMRIGPMRVGPFGILQTIADAIKLVTKEDIIPSETDKILYWLAPIVVFLPSFVVWTVVPFTPSLVIQEMELSLLFILASSTLSIVGLVMAGWSSANKYSVLGALRATAQLISYEIPIIITALTIAMLANSLNIIEIVLSQSSQPYLLLQPMGLLLFFIAALAELGRTPFDIYHAESELAGGPFLEYSGTHWSIFYLAEYFNTFLFATLVSLLFLGGWLGPWLPGIIWLFTKIFIVISIIFWIRGTYPRLRIDQLMEVGWKGLVPLSFTNFVLTAVFIYYKWPLWILGFLGLMSILVIMFAFKQQKSSQPPSIMLIPSSEVRHV
jgi:NADH-quinone oxidoreductase subunit H